jgi:hypothetical protein
MAVGAWSVPGAAVKPHDKYLSTIGLSRVRVGGVDALRDAWPSCQIAESSVERVGSDPASPEKAPEAEGARRIISPR